MSANGRERPTQTTGGGVAGGAPASERGPLLRYVSFFSLLSCPLTPNPSAPLSHPSPPRKTAAPWPCKPPLRTTRTDAGSQHGRRCGKTTVMTDDDGEGGQALRYNASGWAQWRVGRQNSGLTAILTGLSHLLHFSPCSTSCCLIAGLGIFATLCYVFAWPYVPSLQLFVSLWGSWYLFASFYLRCLCVFMATFTCFSRLCDDLYVLFMSLWWPWHVFVMTFMPLWHFADSLAACNSFLLLCNAFCHFAMLYTLKSLPHLCLFAILLHLCDSLMSLQHIFTNSLHLVFALTLWSWLFYLLVTTVTA